MKDARTILVTGGAGFIGSALTRSLLRQNKEVVVLDDFSSGLKSNLKSLDVEIFEGSLADLSLVTAAAQRADAIVHLGARGSVPRSIRNPRATFDANVLGTSNICEVARQRSLPIVFSSSSSVYGANSKLRKTENEWLSPLSPYAASKMSGEAMIISYGRAFGIPTAVFRLFNVYGPGQRPEHQYSAVIPKWIWSAIQDKDLRVFGDGLTSRDFTFIDNVVDILSKTVVESRFFEGVTNLAFGKPVTLLDVLNEIMKLFPDVKWGFEAERAGDIRNSENGSDSLVSLFPEIVPTSLTEGISKTSHWLIENHQEIADFPLEIADD